MYWSFRGPQSDARPAQHLTCDYFETQNYLDSRVSPTAPIVGRIQTTPGYPLTAVAGVTFRLRGK